MFCSHAYREREAQSPLGPGSIKKSVWGSSLFISSHIYILSNKVELELESCVTGNARCDTNN